MAEVLLFHQKEAKIHVAEIGLNGERSQSLYFHFRWLAMDYINLCPPFHMKESLHGPVRTVDSEIAKCL